MSQLSKMACRPQGHDIQQSIFEVVLELTRLDHRLAEIRSTIGLPPDLVEMEEDQVPHDMSAYVSGVIGYVRHDLLEDAIETLKRASEITDAELRAEHMTSGSQGDRPRPSSGKPGVSYAIVFVPFWGPMIFLAATGVAS